MKKVLIFFLFFISLYANTTNKSSIETKTNTINNNKDSSIVSGKVGNWSYKQFSTKIGIKSEFIFLDNINQSKIEIVFGEKVNEIYIAINSKKIKAKNKYFFLISNNVYNPQNIIDYLKDKNINILNGGIRITDKTAHDLILYKFLDYDSIILYDNTSEVPVEIIRFNLKGLEDVFIKLGIIPNS